MTTTRMSRIGDVASIFDGFDAKADTRRKIVVCARELRRLAVRRKSFGVTALDTRQIAIRLGFATGAELDHKALSWFAAVPRAARLFSTPRTRLGLNRNTQRVYVALREWIA